MWRLLLGRPLSKEICDNYSIIAYYFQRPAMNEKFAARVTKFNDNGIPEEVYKLNSGWAQDGASIRLFIEWPLCLLIGCFLFDILRSRKKDWRIVPKKNVAPKEAKPSANPLFQGEFFFDWLAPLFVGLYIAFYSPLVVAKQLPLGTFLATISVFREVSSNFVDGYRGLKKAGSASRLQHCFFGGNVRKNLELKNKNSNKNKAWKAERALNWTASVSQKGLYPGGFLLRALDWPDHLFESPDGCSIAETLRPATCGGNEEAQEGDA